MKPAPLLHGAGGTNSDNNTAVLSDQPRAQQRTVSPPPRRVAESDIEIGHAIEVVIAGRGRTMEFWDDQSGLQSGYTAKILHPLSPNGRVPGGYIRDLLLRAPFPNGYRFVLVERKPDEFGTSGWCQASTLSPREHATSIVSRSNLRARIAESFGRLGGKARAKALSPERRAEIARAAAAARWRRGRK